MIKVDLPASEPLSQWVRRIFLSVSMFMVCTILLGTLIVRAFPNALQGDVISGARHNNIFRNVVELFYFTSNVFLLVVTIAISIFARNQLLATSRAAQADVYISLAHTVLSKEFLDQSSIARTLLMDYKNLPDASRPSKSDFLNQKLQEESFEENAEKLISLLAYVEHIAILIRRRHLSLDDAYLLLEGQLRELEELFMDYLVSMEKRNPRMWEHTIWLLPKVTDYSLKEPLLQ